MLDLRRSEEEIKRLDYEHGAMYRWLQGQVAQLQRASHIAQGTQPIFLPFYILIQPTTRQYLPCLPDRTVQRQPHSHKSGLEYELQYRHW